MKKRFLSLLTALCLMLTLAPAALAADTSGLQDLITNDTTGIITLSQDYTLTDTVTISKAVTINGGGHTITYNGSGSAFSVTATTAVVLNNVTINATASGAYGISLTSSQPNLKLDGCTITVNNRGINMYPANGCTNGKLELVNTTIQNSRVTGDYANNTSVGDTRGIALYGVTNSDIDITNSHIYGFGYSINTSANQGSDGTRPASNRFDITGTDIWGWSAFNIWTVGNTFNITNCDLRGINPLNTVGNSYSVIVLNNGIYGSVPANASPNVLNISGGSLDAKTVQDTDAVEETVMMIDNQFMSEINFTRYNGSSVDMTCDKAFSAIICDATGTSGLDAEFTAWAASNKLTGPENATYNQGSYSIFYPNRGLIAPGVYAGVAKAAASALALHENLTYPEVNIHVGGRSA